MRSSGYSIKMKPASALTYFLQEQVAADSNEKTEELGRKQEKHQQHGGKVEGDGEVEDE